MVPSKPPPHIARWDLDKTYLRTDFDTLRDLVKTALERPDQKRSHPGAAAMLRELQATGVEVHILSGSPEQMRSRLADKLTLDGIRFASLTLKPNLQNILRLRFRSLRGQLGYKLPALLNMRLRVEGHPAVSQGPTDEEDGEPTGALTFPMETLVGDDAEADAFIYALYADVCAGLVGAETLAEVMRIDRCHPEEIADTVRAARMLVPNRREARPVVERVLIHLDQQTPPHAFDVFGSRIVPFYNYFQAALVLLEDGRLSADAVLRVGTDLVLQHRFDGDALLRSGIDLARRGHVEGRAIAAIEAALPSWPSPETRRTPNGLDEVRVLGARAEEWRGALPRRAPEPTPSPDYVSLVAGHNARRKHR